MWSLRKYLVHPYHGIHVPGKAVIEMVVGYGCVGITVSSGAVLCGVLRFCAYLTGAFVARIVFCVEKTKISWSACFTI